jgi:cysteine-rich secretory family protein
MRWGGLVTLLALGAAFSCKQEPQSSVVYPTYTVNAGSSGATPATAPGGVPAPSPASAPAMPPAFGFLCATEQDAQCPFGHCAAGRCGGCSSVADCKTGAQCVPSFVGQVCLPGSSAVPPTQPAPAPATASAGTPLERARQLCVQRTNEYRGRVGVGPLARRADTEACEDAQAKSDGISRTAHGAFGQCRERAQNECPGWDGDPETVVDRCLAMMFAEGPGDGPAHGHYVNMTERKYSGVSCGFASAPNGQLWVVQDFY